MEMHRQCQLRRGNEHLTTWLPEKFAVKGHIVNLKNEGNWIDGWEVVGVFTRMDSRQVSIRSQDHKHQREGSDLKRGSREQF